MVGGVQLILDGDRDEGQNGILGLGHFLRPARDVDGIVLLLGRLAPRELDLHVERSLDLNNNVFTYKKGIYSYNDTFGIIRTLFCD